MDRLAAVGGPSEQRREHLLQASDEVVSLPRPLGQVLDLVVLHADLAAQKLVLAFEPFDVPLVGRDRSRHVRTCRDRSHLLDIGDVLGDRARRDQVLFAERCLYAPAIEMALGAMALD